ncbi:hypothetical protein [Microterricola pindariensis]|uniref:Uncharacterized protein n=1 Tax=Microterricola pindariensis TaxID=478010 RepID=A0ABX5AS16_9MICO|nr:hypothetical protein [Microterricola pindariensis]PPL15021.1 hypothetical protein GY24_15070 [Microterricola pindariensis]
MIASSSRTRGLVLVAAASAILLLTGCATAQTGAAVPGASIPPSAAPVAPSPTPTPTPTAPEEPAAWTIGFDSVGPITLGSEIASVERSMDGFTRAVYEGCESVVSFEKAHVPTIVIPDRLGTGLVEQIVLMGNVDEPGLAEGAPRTVEGIGVGSSLAELRAAYPDIEFQGDPPTPHYGLSDDTGHWILFTLYEDAVQTVVVRDMPVVNREYCS